jgi:hypothetical protein
MTRLAGRVADVSKDRAELRVIFDALHAPSPEEVIRMRE